MTDLYTLATQAVDLQERLWEAQTVALEQKDGERAERLSRVFAKADDRSVRRIGQSLKARLTYWHSL